MHNQSIRKLVVTCCVVGVVFGASSYTQNRQNSGNSDLINEKTEPITYRLADYEGRIAVYSSENAAPVEVFDIQTNSLPEEEYKRILSGIIAKDEKQLHQLIEIYTS